MRAAYYSEFGGVVSIETLADPTPPPDGVVIRVSASGLCLSDWHGWQGHDPDITLPHVPGHELSGVIEETGHGVRLWRKGDRVTLPFVCGCGDCLQCQSGNHQVCDKQFQPGFTHWGSFAERVAIDYADINLVRIPDEVSDTTAASLGCRFATAFRAVADQGKVKNDQWVAVHGCGGVGLSAVMIANALGAKVVAIDLDEEKLAFATKIGATISLNSSNHDDPVSEIRELTGGGVQVSLDAVGMIETCTNSINCLSKRGKHIQVGLLKPNDRNVEVPMDAVVANELEILGSHGMQAYRYPEMLEMVVNGTLKPQQLIGELISLDEVPTRLPRMNLYEGCGVTVIDQKRTF